MSVTSTTSAAKTGALDPALLADLESYLELRDDEARALPAAAYLSDELFQLERERIFRRQWICVGRAEQVAEPGDYFTVELADEPIAVVCGPDRVVRALSSVFRHRYMPVVSGSGRVRTLVCPYHLWTYKLDGRLAGAPHMECSAAFERDGVRLPEFRAEIWEGFVFVNLDPEASPLAPRLETLRIELAGYGLSGQRTSALYDQVWQGNWKIAAENGMECYHHMGLHSTTVQPLTPTAAVEFEEGSDAWNHQRGAIDFDYARKAGIDLESGTEKLDARDRSTLNGIFLYPNMTLALLPNMVNWLSFIPVAVDRTRVLAGMCMPAEAFERGREGDLRRLAQASLDAINREDSQATIQIARSVRSRHAQRGALSRKEAGLAQFYRFLARSLAR